MSIIAIARLNDFVIPSLVSMIKNNYHKNVQKLITTPSRAITGFRLLDTVTGIYEDLEDKEIHKRLKNKTLDISNLCIENNEICGRGLPLERLTRLGSEDDGTERHYILQQLAPEMYLEAISNGCIVPLIINNNTIRSVKTLANAVITTGGARVIIKSLDGRPMVYLNEVNVQYIDGCNAKLRVLDAPYEITYNRGIRVLDSSIESISIADYVTQLSPYTFINCRQLRQVKLPNNLIKIGNRAFAGCVSLQYIKLPDSVESLDATAFTDCKALKKIDMTPDCKLVKATSDTV